MNRTLEAWSKMKPDAFLDGSIVQARNVIEMAQQDIAELGKALRIAQFAISGLAGVDEKGASRSGTAKTLARNIKSA